MVEPAMGNLGNNFIYGMNIQHRKDWSANSIASLGGPVIQNNYMLYHRSALSLLLL